MSEIILVALTRTENGGLYYSGIPDTVKADEARSGCKVWVIGDTSIPCQNFVPYETCSKSGNMMMKSTTPEMRKRWATTSLLRCLAIYDFIQSRNDVSWPIFPLDNDILVFSNLQEVYKPFLDYDFCAPIYGVGTTGAYSVHNLECLNASRDMIFNLIEKESILNDMVVWGRMFQSGKWKVGNLLTKIEGGTFDMNIHLNEGRYVMEPATTWGPETKKIVWKSGHPYFIEISDNSLVLAHWIHCWGSYKYRTKELINEAGL